MNPQERQEWLKSLKVGDRVWNSRQGGGAFYTIKKITPTGKIRLDNDVLLNNDGYGETGYRFNMTYYKIEPITQELLNKIEQQKQKIISIKELNKAIKELDINSWDIEKIKKLNEILKEFKN